MPHTEFEKHGALLEEIGGVGLVEGASDLDGVGLCLVLGGDGTMLRAFHLTRDRCIPVAGVNLGRVGFLTTVDKDDLTGGLTRLLDGRFTEYPLLGLGSDRRHRRIQGDQRRGGRQRQTASRLSSLAHHQRCHVLRGAVRRRGRRHSRRLVRIQPGCRRSAVWASRCDGYVISLIAAHAVGVRPVVAAPGDVLEIINKGDSDCAIDVDGRPAGHAGARDDVRASTRLRG